MNMDRRTAAAVAVTLTLWASAYVVIQIGLPGLGVTGLSVGRLVVASLALACAAPFLGVRRPAPRDLARMAGCGLTGMAGYQFLLNAGERTVPAGTASLLIATGPIFSALLALALLGEPLGVRSRAGIAVGFAGAIVITLGQGGSLRPSTDALLILGAALGRAVFFVLQKPLLSRYSGFEVTCYATWSGTVLALPLLPEFTARLPHAGVRSLAALLFLGVAPSAIAFVTWARTQAKVPVAIASSTLYLVPFLAIGIGWIVLSENVHPTEIGGGLLTLAGAAISRSKPRRGRPDRGRDAAKPS